MAELALTPSLLEANQISAQTTVGVFWRQAERRAGVSLLRFYAEGGWKTVSWHDARRAILRIAGALLSHGVQPGDRVVIMSENRPEWVFTDFAIQLVGAITVPIYPTLTAENAAQIAGDCGARLAIVASALRPKLEGAVPGLVSIEEELPRWIANEKVENEPVIAERAAALAPSDVATIIYTSGTTGVPKGVVLTHEGIATMAASGAQALGLRQDDVLLSFLPYSHVFERVDGIMAPLSVGATIWISRGAQNLAGDLQAARPTLMLLVPRVLEKMLTSIEDGIARRSRLTRAMLRLGVAAGRGMSRDQPSSVDRLRYWVADRVVLKQLRSRLTGGRLRFVVSGGAPLRPEVERFFWSIGLPVYQGWGLTETTSAATANRPGSVRHGTVGRPLPGVEVRAASDQELLIRGPGVMREYLGRADASADALVDGWLKTGDIGAIDADGFVTITDRKKDLIKTSTGKYVAPQPLEARLESYRYIAAAVLVGDQRPYIVALIQPAWDEVRQRLGLDRPIDELAADARLQQLVEEAVETINRGLANFESIKRFRIVAGEFTEANGALTPSLKVRRRLVQQRYQRLIEEMYGSPPAG